MSGHSYAAILPFYCRSADIQMTHIVKVALAVLACFVFATAANGQKSAGDNAGVTLLKGTGNAGIVVVGSAAKGSWALTKATGKYVVLPVAKTVFLKAVPSLGKFALKRSAKHLLPVAIKVGLL